MRKKLLSVALCATMVAGLLAGCGSSSKSDKASSDSKGSVYWLNFKPEADEALQGIAKTYEKENGVKVKVVTAASGNYNSTLTSEMGKSAAPTLFVVGNQAAVKTWDDYCIDLKDTDVYKELSTDAFNLKDENGKVIDEAKNDKAGAISFKALEFDKAGTYKYTISEVNDKQKEIKYDTSEKTVTITVKDSGDGYLQAQVESEKQLIFTNTFEAAGGSGTKTGDNMNLVLPIMMMLTAAAIGSVLLIRRKYHR